MAVPARPASGAVVDSAWGQVVHDTAVAQDIQTGTFTAAVPAAGGAVQVNFSFPRPFASAPTIVGSVSASGANDASVNFQNVTATTAQAGVRAGTGPFTYSVLWIAIGPRA